MDCNYTCICIPAGAREAIRRVSVYILPQQFCCRIGRTAWCLAGRTCVLKSPYLPFFVVVLHCLTIVLLRRFAMLLRSLWMCVSSYSFIQIVKLASSRMFCQRNLCLHVCWNARCVTVLMFYGLHVYSDLKIIKIQAHILMHAMKQITEHTTRRSLVKNIFPLYSQRVTCQTNRRFNDFFKLHGVTQTLTVNIWDWQSHHMRLAVDGNITYH